LYLKLLCKYLVVLRWTTNTIVPDLGGGGPDLVSNPASAVAWEGDSSKNEHITVIHHFLETRLTIFH